MSNSRSVNIAKLMTSYKFEIEELPDNLKCANCKLMLKDACQVPCGCTFCRACIDDMMASGDEFCPGVSEDCSYTLLSSAAPDYRANKSISVLSVKCPHKECQHKCPLANMKEHLQKCQRKSVQCPFRQLGCTQDQLTAEGMDRHLQLDNRRHNEILIGIIANVSKEMETSKNEIELLKQRDRDSVRQIEILTQRDGESRREIEKMKRELVLKDGQIRAIMDQMNHVANDNKEIKREKDELIDRVKVLSVKIDQEVTEKRESDALDSVRVIEHVDSEIAAIMAVLQSNKAEFGTQIKSVTDNIQSINHDVISVKDEMCSMTQQRQSLQQLVGQGVVDATCEWVIDDVWKTHYSDTKSEPFKGKVHQYNFQLGQMNRGLIGDVLRIYLRIVPGAIDSYLVWPFVGRVVISVADKDKRETRKSIWREVRIDKSYDNNYYGCSDCFVFRYSELIEAGLDLSHGMCVLCDIVPGMAT